MEFDFRKPLKVDLAFHFNLWKEGILLQLSEYNKLEFLHGLDAGAGVIIRRCQQVF